ncbi:MAG: BON domain-containing protein [Acidobacteriota bacterium]|nr:BON domain-containing protein [Acidobacteriota bacterium]
MRKQIFNQKHSWLAGAAMLALAVGLASGCKTQQPAEQPVARTDQQIANDVQAKIQGESALAGQSIQISVTGGVATLSGTVNDDASRALAGNDSGAVDGVKTVVNNLTVQPQQTQARGAAPPSTQSRSARPRYTPPQQTAAAPAPVQPAPPVQAAPVPAAPQGPVVKEITIAAGTVVPVRMTDALDTKTAQPNDVFHGTLASDLKANGVVALPRGTPILGRVVDAKGAAHFKGNSLLTIELTQLTAHGQKISLVTDAYSKEGKGRGKDTAVKTGAGAAVGAIIGALAGGGKGAAIGAAAGGGTGAGINAITRGQEVQIPAETLLNFNLQSPITVTVTLDPSGNVVNTPNPEPQLQHR